MSIAVTPVHSVALRAALRRLYPELPPQLQRLLILSPAPRVLRAAFHSLPRWPTVPEALTALARTKEALSGAQICVGKHGDRYIKVASGELLMEFAARPGVDGLPANMVASITTRGAQGTALTCERLAGLRCRGSVIGRRFWAYAQGAADESLAIHGGEDTLFRGITRQKDVLLLADGSPSLLRRHEGRWVPSTQGALPDHDASVAALVARWQALPSTRDRTDIGAFWLGQNHPILAEAGMRVLQSPSLRRGLQ
jgi:hypothetical protein